MRYARIRKMDVVNGEGLGIALFVQGCHFHCKGCFNKETWNFDGGNEWNDETAEYFYSLCDNDFIKRISILGGEPLAPENVNDVLDIVKNIRFKYPDKIIWLYTGYDFEKLNDAQISVVSNCDYIVDGRYIEELKDFNLKYRGSSNQRVIKVGDV